MYRTCKTSFLAILILLTAGQLTPATRQSAPNVSVNGSFNAATVSRGRMAHATVTMDIPSGYHANSNRPLEKFLIATQLQIDAPQGVRVGPVNYPRAVLRSLKFSKNRVSVFEGRTVMRFSVTVPRNYKDSSLEVKARLRFQACNDDTCFPPQNREVRMRISVE
jgi:hypothetical protein